MTASTTLDLPRRLRDRLADRYAAKPVPDRALYERELEIPRVLLGPQARVLGVGRSTGSTAPRLAPRERLRADRTARTFKRSRHS